MCLTAAGRVVSVDDSCAEAVIDVSGRVCRVSLAPIVLDGGHVDSGAWVLVHTGFAVAVIDERDARELIAASDALARAGDPSR